MRIALTVFLVGHAAVHAVMWTLPFTDATREMPFDPGHSWVFGDSRVPAVVLAGLATVGFAVSGAGLILQAGWWPVAMVASAAVSLVLMIGWFTPWWLVGIALSAGLAVFAWQSQPVT
jgi:hypothetical protein